MHREDLKVNDLSFDVLFLRPQLSVRLPQTAIHTHLSDSGWMLWSTQGYAERNSQNKDRGLLSERRSERQRRRRGRQYSESAACHCSTAQFFPCDVAYNRLVFVNWRE